MFQEVTIAVIGLGYVGAPLAIEFAKKFPTIGFDIDPKRIYELDGGFDSTGELSRTDLENSSLIFTSNAEHLVKANCYIVTVPTPVDKENQPNLNPLKSACKLVGAKLKPNDYVIFESTVYPGCTEEFCVPLLEAESQLVFNIDFYCGYSPERINPGSQMNISNIIKVTSGSSPEASLFVDQLYSSIIDAGTFRASSIKVAEAAKVIENTQRDLNIALMNELSMLFKKAGVPFIDVINAAKTKWNFLDFVPGLVGGHCIGVDPYYLTYFAKKMDFDPKIILSGREINDGMPGYIINQIEQFLHSLNKQSRIKYNCLIMGLTFKENCPDFRNSKAVELAQGLIKRGMSVDVNDPYMNCDSFSSLNFNKVSLDSLNKKYEVIIVCVAHKGFKSLSKEWFEENLVPGGLLFDVKSIIQYEDHPGLNLMRL